jgi:mannan endo-1,4-beta-mannosidase
MKIIKFLLGLMLPLIAFSCNDNDNTAVDSNFVAPTLVSSSVTDGATDVASRSTVINLIFDRAIYVCYSDSVKLNGSAVSDVTVSGDTLQVTVSSLAVSTAYKLHLGKYSVKAVLGKVNTDEINISFSTGSGTIASSLVMSNASAGAIKVYNYLKSEYGSKVLSATMANVNWNTDEADWVYNNTGKYPAINCFDFIHIYASPSNWINYNNTDVVENWWNNGGLVACMWHWNMKANDGTDYAFNYGTQTTETSFDVSKISDTSSDEYKQMVADIDTVAAKLLLLQNKGIPVIWRPLHEASGAWFWWGAQGATAFKALWKLMFTRFEAKGLNNLIWVWTSEGDDTSWYPGDNYVDIIGRDSYPTSDIHASRVSDFNELNNIVGGNKMVTLSECGGIPDPSTMFADGASWSWFMPWYGNYTESDTENGATYWKTVMSSDKVITRDQLPSFK